MKTCVVCSLSTPWDDRQCPNCNLPLVDPADPKPVQEHALAVVEMLVHRRVTAAVAALQEPQIVRPKGVPQLAWSFTLVGALAASWQWLFRPSDRRISHGFRTSSEN